MSYSSSDAFGDLLDAIVPGYQPADEEDEEDPGVYVEAALAEVERLRVIERCARQLVFSGGSKHTPEYKALRQAVEPEAT